MVLDLPTQIAEDVLELLLQPIRLRHVMVMVTVMVVVQVVSLALFRTPPVLIGFHINLVIVCVSAIKIFLANNQNTNRDHKAIEVGWTGDKCDQSA